MDIALLILACIIMLAIVEWFDPKPCKWVVKIKEWLRVRKERKKYRRKK